MVVLLRPLARVVVLLLLLLRPLARVVVVLSLLLLLLPLHWWSC